MGDRQLYDDVRFCDGECKIATMHSCEENLAEADAYQKCQKCGWTCYGIHGTYYPDDVRRPES